MKPAEIIKPGVRPPINEKLRPAQRRVAEWPSAGTPGGTLGVRAFGFPITRVPRPARAICYVASRSAKRWRRLAPVIYHGRREQRRGTAANILALVIIRLLYF